MEVEGFAGGGTGGSDGGGRGANDGGGLQVRPAVEGRRRVNVGGGSRTRCFTEGLIGILLEKVGREKQPVRNKKSGGAMDYTREKATPIEAEEEMLEGFIMNLRHVKELKIGVLCSKVLSRLVAKGFILPSNIKFSYAFCNVLEVGDA
ncbi:unnamed protein product [Lactuca saligna]|uniref:Uncharacterized protein n=1 Tax=Lactuca saligna TaxID=75948 RepID=A0AA35ZHP9_LACSI|nr:unnamed protein product [Lactuca saligna]